MKSTLKKQLIETLKDQKEIFGDDLFEEIEVERKTTVVADKKNTLPEESKLFPNEKKEWERAETLVQAIVFFLGPLLR